MQKIQLCEYKVFKNMKLYLIQIFFINVTNVKGEIRIFKKIVVVIVSINWNES